jgi:NAD(P)-dependent dehydrogenase (short-subunit alcohol dehydrogenase family)
MAQRDLAGACVVITGASSGIGRAAAQAFAAAGAHLVLAGRSRQALATVAHECERAGARALIVETDVTNAKGVAHLAGAAIEAHGRLDVWVNNAGVFAFGPFVDTPVDAHVQVIKNESFGLSPRRSRGAAALSASGSRCADQCGVACRMGADADGLDLQRQQVRRPRSVRGFAGRTGGAPGDQDL